MADFTMPSLGADMEEGTLLEWLVKPGDTVRKGDIVAVVDTAKAAVEVESFVEGVVQQLLVAPGTIVPVGQVLATLGDTGATASDVPAPAPALSRVPPPDGPHPGPPVHSPLVRREAKRLGVDLTRVRGTGPAGAITRPDVTRAAEATVRAGPPQPVAPGVRIRVTPYARRLATELGVDLSTLTRPDGEPIRVEDVRAAASGAAAVPHPPETEVAHASRPDAMRTAIATLMARSKREIPHYYLASTVDLTRALDWLRMRNRDLAVSDRLVPAALMLKATALAAQGAPALNGFWIDGSFRPAEQVHLGIAISLRGGGLVAPALHDAANLSVADLMAQMRDLVTRARSGRLRGSEINDPTLTVTNLGEQGVELVHGVIYPPQVALVGFGRVVERPWAVGGLIGVRPVTTVTLAGDHRATDGFTGARLLADIEQYLQQPEEL
jgi:pyruvate dehydrogenase E2 component (dihydrolipoamide acetyltransferase)